MEQTIKIQKILKNSNFINTEIEKESNTILLRAARKDRVPGQSKRTIKTGTAFEIPEGFVGLIISSENLTENYPLSIISQIISPANRDEIQLNVVNHSSYPENIEFNQVIGKLILLPTTNILLKTVKKIKKIDSGE